MLSKQILVFYSKPEKGQFPVQIVVTHEAPFKWHVDCLNCRTTVKEGYGSVNTKGSNHDFNKCMKNCKANIAGKDN